MTKQIYFRFNPVEMTTPSVLPDPIVDSGEAAERCLQSSITSRGRRTVLYPSLPWHMLYAKAMLEGRAEFTVRIRWMARGTWKARETQYACIFYTIDSKPLALSVDELLAATLTLQGADQ